MKATRSRRAIPGLVALVVLLLAALLSACGQTAAPSQPPAQKPADKPASSAPASAPASSPAAAQPKAPVKLRIARTSGPASGHLYVADAEGILKKNALDATIKTFPSSNDAVSALLAGDVDTAAPSAQTVNSLIDRGAEIVILAVHSRSPRDMKVVARSEISSAKDLKGKKVAATRGTSSEFLTSQFLTKGGLAASDVEWVYADPPELVALLDKNEASAFSLWEPFPSKAIEVMGNKAKIMAVSADLGYNGTLYQLTTRKALQDSKEGLTRLLSSLIEANQLIVKDPQKAAKPVAEASQMDPAQILPVIQAADFNVVADKAMLDELRSIGQWLKDGGRMKEVPDYSKYMDASLLKAIDAKAVTQ